MFGFNRKRIELPEDHRQEFLSILERLEKTLTDQEHDGQAEIVKKSIQLLLNNDVDFFIKSINGVDFWGGSGAVWEVGILNDEVSYEFENEIIRLIDLMQRSKIFNRKIKSIKKYFLASSRD